MVLFLMVILGVIIVFQNVDVYVGDFILLLMEVF